MVKSQGAELRSLRDKKTGTEHMWRADPKYWGRSAPILFPAVGGLKNGQYRFEGKTYSLEKHGFARNMEFALKEQTEDSLWFSVTDTEQTRESYPFRFLLELGYILEGRNLKVLWRVVNTDQKTMYFSIGGHPAFHCPPGGEGDRTQCYIGFAGTDRIVSSGIGMEDGLANGVKKDYILENGLLKISEHLFDEDALVIEGDQTHAVSLCGADKQPYIKVEFDAPLFGVWSVPDSSAPYVCIEPWYGRCDHTGFSGSLQDREWGNALEAGQAFEKEYTITVF